VKKLSSDNINPKNSPQKISLSMKNAENLDAKELLEGPLNIFKHYPKFELIEKWVAVS